MACLAEREALERTAVARLGDAEAGRYEIAGPLLERFRHGARRLARGQDVHPGAFGQRRSGHAQPGALAHHGVAHERPSFDGAQPRPEEGLELGAR
jgi:hypothetical protein